MNQNPFALAQAPQVWLSTVSVHWLYFVGCTAHFIALHYSLMWKIWWHVPEDRQWWNLFGKKCCANELLCLLKGVVHNITKYYQNRVRLWWCNYRASHWGASDEFVGFMSTKSTDEFNRTLVLYLGMTVWEGSAKWAGKWLNMGKAH